MFYRGEKRGEDELSSVGDFGKWINIIMCQ